MSGLSIKQICDYCSKVYNSIDLDGFDGYFSPTYDGVIRFLKLNKRLFTRNDVDFSMSIFSPLLTEVATYDIVERGSDETDNVE